MSGQQQYITFIVSLRHYIPPCLYYIIDMSGLFKKSMEAIKKQKQNMEEEKIKIGGIDFDDLSSSEQQKLKERGTLKTKRIQKVRKEEPVWEKGKVVKTIDRQRHTHHPKHNPHSKPKPKPTYTITFEMTSQKLTASDIYNTLSSFKIFIQELKLNYPVGVIIFGSEEAAQKSFELISKSQFAKNPKLEKPNSTGQSNPQAESNQQKSSIFSRFS